MRHAYSPRAKREPCPKCGKKTLSFHRTFCDDEGRVRKGWVDCRSCKATFDRVHIIGFGYELKEQVAEKGGAL